MLFKHFNLGFLLVESLEVFEPMLRFLVFVGTVYEYNSAAGFVTAGN